jgi:putative tryptophan/tyrosine transport system substrate-binding protein
MKRRVFTRLLAGAALLPSAAYAQRNPEAPKVGYVYTGAKELAASRIGAIVDGLRASGFAPQQVELVVRITEGDPTRMAPMIDEVMAKNVTVFIANGPVVLQAARAITRERPIVAIDFESDPVAAGYVANIARPGGNVTGVFLDFPNFAGKWIELLLECLPKLSRIALMWDPPTGPVQVDAVAKTAAPLNIQTDLLEVRVPGDYAGAFAVAKDRGAGAVIMLSSPLVPASVKQLAELSLRHKLPAITMFSEFPRTGGLLSYGPNLLSATRQLGVLAGKVLSGTAPANLPIERPSKFELIVNMRTAQALDLAIPASIQVRADEVIE